MTSRADERRYVNSEESGPSSSAGISLPVTDWQDSHVSSWLSTLNLPSLAPSFSEQGITGDILVQLDNEALKDLGVRSVGQRLALLGGIFKLKEIWGLEIEEGDYRPQSEEIQSTLEPPVTVAQLVTSLRQRDERIFRLEQELRRTTLFLAKFQHDFGGLCKYQGVTLPSLDQSFRPFSSARVAGNPASLGEGTNGGKTGRLDGNDSGANKTIAAQHQAAYSPTHSSAGKGVTPTSSVPGYDGGGHSEWVHVPQLPESARLNSFAAANQDWPGEERMMTPISANRFDVEANQGHHRNGGSQSELSGALGEEQVSNYDGRRVLSPTGSPASRGAGSTPSSATFPPWGRPGRDASQSSNPSSQSKPVGNTYSSGRQPSSPSHPQSLDQRSGRPASPISRPRIGSPAASPTTPSAVHSPVATKSSNQDPNTPLSARSSTARDFAGTATSLGSSDNPYKSFRVTLEDPCYKVLPAALKKYKINDDWRLYALFICYGTTERCLSYDEKPLLLFQKLKEAKLHPVFMLRHLRDVKSPIAIANAKAAARKESSAVMASGGKKLGESSTGSAHAKKEIVLPGEQDGSGEALRSQAILTGPAAQLPNLDGPKTFAVAIYPYSCEREDEFDVGVGDTFVVLSKAKGWWVVQRDSGATGLGDIAASPSPEDTDDSNEGKVNSAEIRSGWVPAGCLIETSKPLAAVVSMETGEDNAIGPDTGSSRGASSSSEALDYPSQVVSNRSMLTGGSEDAATPTPASVRGATGSSGGTSSGRGGPMSRVQKDGPTVTSKSLLDRWEKASVPIPPSVITSTSTPGIMLMEYSSTAAAASFTTSTTSSTTVPTNQDDGPSTVAEGAPLELQKDDRLRVFKRYNHWSYCVQENGSHARGWVPSWYIGKISPRANTASGGGGSGGSHASPAGGAGEKATVAARAEMAGGGGGSGGGGGGRGLTAAATATAGSGRTPGLAPALSQATHSVGQS